MLCYVKGTSDYGLLYSRSSNPKLSGFTYSDWAGSVDDKKSTSGLCSVWDLVQSHGPVRSSRQFLSLPQRPNTKGLLR